MEYTAIFIDDYYNKWKRTAKSIEKINDAIIEEKTKYRCYLFSVEKDGKIIY